MHEEEDNPDYRFSKNDRSYGESKEAADEAAAAKAAELGLRAAEAADGALMLRDALKITIDPHRRIDPELLRHLKLTITSDDGTELEIPLEEIEVNRRHRFNRRRGPAPSFFVCANCSERIPRTGDTIEDHHTGQRHKIECSGRQRAEAEHAQMVEQFSEQQKLISPETRRLLAAGVAIEPESRRLARRPWWKFWR